LDYSLEHKIRKAAEFEKSGKYLHAIQIYSSLIKEHPHYIDSFILLALLYEKTEQIDSAIDVFKTGLNLNSKNTDLSMSSGQFFIRNKLWNDALSVLIDVSPEEKPLVSLLIADAYFHLNEHELSKMHLLRFIISDEQPKLIHEAYLYLAKIEYLFNRFEDAMKYVRKAELLLNDLWELHFVKSKILYKLKMYSHSAKAIEWALKLNSKEPELLSWAGKIYIECEDFEKAESHLIKFVESQQSASTENHLALADALQNPDISERKKTLSKLINSITASDA
jgi:tetratricopeptide (TPR) repeat protein